MIYNWIVYSSVNYLLYNNLIIECIITTPWLNGTGFSVGTFSNFSNSKQTRKIIIDAQILHFNTNITRYALKYVISEKWL